MIVLNFNMNNLMLFLKKIVLVLYLLLFVGEELYFGFEFVFLFGLILFDIKLFGFMIKNGFLWI